MPIEKQMKRAHTREHTNTLSRIRGKPSQEGSSEGEQMPSVTLSFLGALLAAENRPILSSFIFCRCLLDRFKAKPALSVCVRACVSVDVRTVGVNP